MKTCNMNKYKIYYHNDMDGMCSRVIAEKIIEQRHGPLEKNDRIEAYKLSYKSTDVEYINKIDGDETLVIIVDYSFTDNTLDIFKEILRKTNGGRNLLWIDHHDSSIKFVEDHIIPTGDGERISMPTRNFLISKAGSAAYLTWTMYQPENFKDLNILKFKENRGVFDMYKKVRYVPPAVRYVSDYDTFEHRFQNTDKFKLGYDSKPDKYAFMKELFNFYGGWDEEEIQEQHPDKYVALNECGNAIAVGAIIETYITAENQTIIKAQGYESCIKDLRTGQMELVYVCNRLSNSWVFGDLYDRYKYVIVYHFTGTEYKYSIFSNLKLFSDTNCSNYAEQFGGGGHKGAAGWRSKELMFLKNVFVFNGTESCINFDTVTEFDSRVSK